MKSRRLARFATASLSAALLLVFGLAGPAVAQEESSEQELYDTELAAELIHSDLPLYSFEWDNLWPRNFTSEEDEEWVFGCESRVAFGDWRFKPNPIDEHGAESWMRVANYGAIHCAANLHEARDHEELDEGTFSRGFFVRLRSSQPAPADRELWALQKGMVPGSDYILLAREPTEGLAREPTEGLVEKFTVLQQRCPEEALRRSEGLDVWSSRYCAINTHADLLALAEAMLVLPHYGTLQTIPSPDDAEPPGETGD